MVRIQAHLEEEQASRLRQAAAIEDTSVSEIIRRALGSWLRERGPISLAERKRRALAVVGRYSSGRSDVSRHHDEYLAEALEP